jgi:hypothetical protein
VPWGLCGVEDRLPPMHLSYSLEVLWSTLGSHNPLHSAAADAHVLSNAALGPAVAAQSPGALLGALSGPQQDQDRQQQEHGGASGNARDVHCWASIAVAKAVIAAATC